MKRPLTACVALALSLVLSWPSAVAEAPIYAKLVVPLLFEDEIPRDVGLVNQAINEITRNKIGAEVVLVPLLYNASPINQDPRKAAELKMLERQGTCFDVLPDTLPDAKFIPLDALLAQYGQDILRIVGDKRLSYSKRGGVLYKLPSVSDYVASAGLTMRKDIVRKHAIDLTTIHTLQDLDALFADVKAKEPDMMMTCGYRTGGSFLYRLKYVDTVNGSVYSQSASDPLRLVNHYATSEYRSTVTLIRKWHELGYVPPNLALQNLTASQLVRTGELFSYFSAYKPGIEYEESVNCGMEMVTVSLMEPVITQRSLSMRHWGIAENCTNPGKAMKFLNLLYSDSALVNLLLYGIEGTHYVARRDGTIEYPLGVMRQSTGYLNKQPWLLPNQLISHVWAGNDPRLWEQTKAYNNSAAFHDAAGFVFDATILEEENQRLNAIASRYYYGLETGQLDPEIYLPQMLAEMEEAGIKRALEEAQAQFDAWRSRKEPQ